ncbi:MAG: hypothetical protein BRD29_02950 [Bacteroidetes bacterium QH_2_67_10]|nr:MAG: hypothetical protein BRD29_02950 [Bacteroidetes bacterium QH_2_67_10]
MRYLLALFRPPASFVALLGLGGALCIASAASVLSGCGSSGPAVSEVSPGEARKGSRVASTLRSATARWEGTPYQMGGTTRRGVDCSGFVQRLYRDELGVKLSRSTRAQVQQGRRISEDHLRPGDLVFFRPARKSRHVGVYVGDGEFAHASTSAGVTISSLERDYWQDAYWTARRVLRLTSASPEEVAAGSASERTSW